MKKSLVPLIIVLTAIVVLTAILVNTRPTMSLRDKKEKTAREKASTINLGNRKRKEITDEVRRKDFVMDNKTVLRMLYQAYNELEKGNLKEAEDKVKTVLVFQAENIEALSLLGKIYYLQHDYKSAELIFRRQVRLNKSSASAYNNLGQVLLKQHKASQAILQFRIAQELDPDSGLIALNLSGAYSLEERKQESLESFEKAFKLLGSKIIPVANHPALDNIRNEKEFQDILRKAYQQLPEKPQEVKEPLKDKK